MAGPLNLVILTSASVSPWTAPRDMVVNANHVVWCIAAGGNGAVGGTGTSGAGGGGGGGGGFMQLLLQRHDHSRDNNDSFCLSGSRRR